MTASQSVVPPDGSVVSYADGQPRGATAALPQDARGAVVVPAHDEAGVIARTLRSLEPLTELAGIEVVVVANGCTDDTAKIARTFAGVRVVETDRGSKTGALNLGDEVATAWPRLYLDADIDILPETVLAVFGALGEPGVLGARAFYVYDTAGASWPVRAYYRARSRTPAPPLRLWGAGGYATNEHGHARFGRFADVTADDSWFDEQFADDEKRVVAAPPMRVRTPRDTPALLAILTRQRRGYVELGIPPSTGERGRGLLGTVRGLRSALDVAWYAWFTVLSRRKAEQVLRQRGRGAWERDGSSRETARSTGEAA